MYCPYCRTQNDDGATFCEVCGKPLGNGGQTALDPALMQRLQPGQAAGAGQIPQPGQAASGQIPQPGQVPGQIPQPGQVPGRIPQPGQVPGQTPQPGQTAGAGQNPPKIMPGGQNPPQGWGPQGVNPPVQPVRQTERRPISRSTVIIAVEAVVLLVIGFLCYNRIQTLGDPRTVVNGYMEAVTQENWAEAYSYLNMPSSPFLSLEAYQNYMEASDMKDITNYSVNRATKNSGGGGLLSEYEVSYTTKTNTSKSTIHVQLTKSREKKWKVVDDWRISLMDNLLNDVEISAAPMLEVKIDGVLLNDETAEVMKSGDQVIYTISDIFEGTHVIEVGGPGMEPYKQEAAFLGDGDYAQMWIPYMSDEQLQALGSKCAEYWGKLMEGAVSGQEAEDMPEELQNGYGDAVWTLGRSVDADYITHMENKNPTVILDDFEYWDGRLQASVTMKTDMEVTGVSEVSSGYEQRTAKGVGAMSATYHFEDGEWILDTYYVSYSNN